MTHSDPAIRLETLAAALGVALQTVRRARIAGKIPETDTVIKPLFGQPARAWKLSTIRAWNPAVADRCAQLAPAPLPPMAA